MSNVREVFTKDKRTYSELFVDSFSLTLQVLFLVVKNTDNSEESYQLIKRKQNEVYSLLMKCLKCYVSSIIGGSHFGNSIVQQSFFNYNMRELQYPKQEFEV